MDSTHAIQITDDLEQLLDILPPQIKSTLSSLPSLETLIEVVLDFGRCPEARFPKEFHILSSSCITREDISYVVSRIGTFGKDNRAGIERTLHRISAIRNRTGDIVGLTCRVGRAVYGTIDIINDLLEKDRNILFLGRPGVGKTTMLREMARVLSDVHNKRVIIVDTSNEIAGDGDIPHPGIGKSRRMQVTTPELQHSVMIEAVENHMPEVIVVDEIGVQEEAYAARTIAERGVQLIATAHGNTLENLLMNPTLSDLIGGIQAVTLSDEEAKKRGTQKTVLERKAPPTFDTVIEIKDRDMLVVHHALDEVVDQLLRGKSPAPEMRVRREDGRIDVITTPPEMEAEDSNGNCFVVHPRALISKKENARIFPYGVSRNRLEKAILNVGSTARVVRTWDTADVILTLKNQEKKESRKFRAAIYQGIPIVSIRSNTVVQIEGFLKEYLNGKDVREEEDALRETRKGIEYVMKERKPFELSPQRSSIRRLQHELIQEYKLGSTSLGEEPHRRVKIHHQGEVSCDEKNHRKSRSL
jgi:stage III sporulation protein AA